MSTKIEWFDSFKPLIMVIVVAVTGYWGADRATQEINKGELDLEKKRVEAAATKDKEERKHQIRTDYLSKAIEDDDREVRLRYLRYLVATEKDEDFNNWALIELKIVGDELDKAKEEVATLNSELKKVKLEKKAAELLIKEADAKLVTANTELEIEKATKILDQRKFQLAILQEQSSDINSEIGTILKSPKSRNSSFGDIFAYECRYADGDSLVMKSFVNAASSIGAWRACKKEMDVVCRRNTDCFLLDINQIDG